MAPELDDRRADTDRWSYYVDAEFYAELVTLMERFDEDWPPASSEHWHAAAHLLSLEARLLDERRFADWLGLYARACVYWVPAARGAADPRDVVAHAFDDRRRLADRVYWLDTGLAYSQVPPSRTVHVVSNIDVRVLDDSTMLVRSAFATHEYRTAEPRVLAGRNAHVLTREGGQWRIRVRRVSLIDADAGHENLTVVL